MSRSALLVCLSVAVSSLGAKFEAVPAEPKGAPTGLLMRVVEYDGATNGALTVEVKNPTEKPLEFSAGGIFFVPAVDPDQAPQRLGAVGPFLKRGQTERAERLAIEPGATERLMLDVYCIDSHRASPTSQTPFRVGKERMPRQLTQDISENTRKAAESLGGVSAPAAKSSVQGEVWKSRDRKWIKLDGEGKQEYGK